MNQVVKFPTFINPPLRQVEFHYHFLTNENEDWKNIYLRDIITAFPNYPKLNIAAENNVKIDFINGGINYLPQEVKNILVLKSEDEKKQIILRDNTISLLFINDVNNNLYSWDVVSKEIIENINKIIAIIKIKTATQLLLKYTNHLQLEKDKYFYQLLSDSNIYAPSICNNNNVGFATKTTISMSMYEHQSISISTNNLVEQGVLKNILLMEFERVSTEVSDLTNSLLNRINKLHDDIEAAFFASISKEYRLTLKEV